MTPCYVLVDVGNKEEGTEPFLLSQGDGGYYIAPTFSKETVFVSTEDFAINIQELAVGQQRIVKLEFDATKLRIARLKIELVYEWPEGINLDPHGLLPKDKVKPSKGKS